MNTDGILIREITPTDAESVAALSGELGYPADAEAMAQRIEQIRTSPDHVVFVACLSNAVVGWIDVVIVHHLSTGASGEICGLIVSAGHRSAGIGQKLVLRAERWVRDQGVTRMTVRSRTTREQAHRFYLREGYSFVKTSAVFSKDLT